MDEKIMDEKFNCECEDRPTIREATVIEEIERLPIEEYLKESILRRLKRDASRKSEMENELYRCHNEIESLEKAVIYLSKIVGECKERN